MKIGFIGCGNMGGAVAKAAALTMDGKDLYLTGKSARRSEALAREIGANACDKETICRECAYIFLGVKPQNMAQVLAEMAPVLSARRDRFVLVTMAAGLEISRIRAMAGGDYPVIRIMPNLPVSVGEGVVLWCADGVKEDETEAFKTMLARAGRLEAVEEKLIDAGSAVSGCGPAFACMFIEALADAGVSCGLRRDTAQALAEQMLLGTAKQLLETGAHPGALKDAVCSPGGTTIAGVMALDEGAFRSDVQKAVLAAYEKTLKLKG